MKRFVIGFIASFKGDSGLFIHLSGNLRPHYFYRWQRSFYKALTLDLIRGRFRGKYTIYDIY